MVINMNEERLDTILKIEQFLGASAPIEFSASGDDSERYGHISRVLKRFDYPQRGKRERGVLLRYLERTSGYSRAQITRLVTRWQRNRLAEVPLVKRYGRPTVSTHSFKLCIVADYGTANSPEMIVFNVLSMG